VGIELVRKFVAGRWKYVAEEEETGGGLEVLGPMVVTFDTEDIATQALVFDLASGTIVVKAWALIVTPWNSPGSNQLNLGIGPADWATGDWWLLTSYDAQQSPLRDANAGVEASNVASDTPPSANLRAGLTAQAGALIANVTNAGGAPTAGEAIIYALVTAQG